MGWVGRRWPVLLLAPWGCLSVPDAEEAGGSSSGPSSGSSSITSGPVTESTTDRATDATGSPGTTVDPDPSATTSAGTSDETTGSMPAQGLIGHWPLDEGMGNMPQDESGNGLHGAVVGTANWVSSLGGGVGLGFDPMGSERGYVELPDTDPLDDFELGSHSISAWFRPLSIPAGSGPTFEYAVVVRSGFHRGLSYGADQNLWFDAWLESGDQVGAPSGFLPPGAWYHAVGLLDADSGRVQLYVDGQLAGTEAFDADSQLAAGDGPWRMGVADPGASRFENAAHIEIDDVRFYDRVLTLEEIQELFVAGP